MNEAVVSVKMFRKRYGDTVAVKDISFDVRRGEIFALLGPNGAGKTSTLESLEGLRRPDGGSLTIDGLDPTRQRRRLRNTIGVQLQSSALPPSMTVDEAMRFFCSYHGVAARHDLVERLGLSEKRRTQYGQLSTGLQRRLALAVAVAHEPAVLFLDEPTASLDPEAAKVVRDLIETLRTKERTIFLCTHNLDEADRLCDRVALFKRRLIALGSPQELKEGRYGRRTVVHLAHPRPGLEEALRLPFVKKVERVDGKLLVSLADPERQNPVLVRRLVELGAEVQFVNELRYSLEDLYLDLLEGSDAAH